MGNRYYYNKKTTVEDCRSIDTANMKKWGCFNGGYYGGFNWSRNGKKTAEIGSQVDNDNSYLRVFYTQTDRYTKEKESFDYKIRLSATPCNYGGKRFWFHCPYCSKRTRTLHLYRHNKFACRGCLNLSYRIRNKGGFEKLIGKTMSYPEMEEMRKSIRPYYKGKVTKRYKQYLKYEIKFTQILNLWTMQSEALIKRLNKK